MNFLWLFKLFVGTTFPHIWHSVVFFFAESAIFPLKIGERPLNCLIVDNLLNNRQSGWRCPSSSRLASVDNSYESKLVHLCYKNKNVSFTIMLQVIKWDLFGHFKTLLSVSFFYLFSQGGYVSCCIFKCLVFCPYLSKVAKEVRRKSQQARKVIKITR